MHELTAQWSKQLGVHGALAGNGMVQLHLFAGDLQLVRHPEDYKLVQACEELVLTRIAAV